MFVRYAAVLMIAVSLARAAEVRGKITNAVGGEPLGLVQVLLPEITVKAVTSRDGSFKITGIAEGKYTLRVSAVGYRLITLPCSIENASQVKEFEISLAPDNFRRTDKVEVRGDVFQDGDSIAIPEINLTSSEIKEASTVLADDPFRAIQSLPGVSASGNNELFAEFSVAGASFGDVGIYLDDVLIPSPTHTVPNQGLGASLSLLSSETVEEMKLMMAAYPEKFGDAIGAALDVRTREGSRTRPVFRLAPGIADSEFLGEGGLGSASKGSWLVSARKSYIGWLVQNRIGPDFSDVSFYDADVKLSYDVAAGQNVNLYTIGGRTNVRTLQPTTNGFTGGAGDFYFSRLGWTSTISKQLLLRSRLAYIRQPFVEHYSGAHDSHQDFREWTGGSELVWNVSKYQVFDGGLTLRRMGYPYVSGALQPNGTVTTTTVNPVTIRGTGYLQQASSFFGNRVHLFGGIRYDQSERYPDHPLSPQISSALQIAKATTLQFGYGHYIQNLFPPSLGYSPACVPGSESWEGSNHYTAAFEQRATENIRVRIEAFRRQSTSMLHLEGPLPSCSGNSFVPAHTMTWGHARSEGVQLILQRRSANRLSGWIGYTLVYASQNSLFQNTVTHAFLFTPDYSSFEDQRHSLNAFATYRLRPTINLSGKFLFGSGFPVSSGYGPGPGGGVQLVPVQRQTPYLRVDVRTDKSWAWARWKLTVYGEVLNLSNHQNRIVTSFFYLPNGGLQTTTAPALPITPTVGLAFEF